MDKKNKKITSFDEVSTKVNFPSLEEDLLKSWHDDGLVEDYITCNNASKKHFSFLDGPITANNPMGVHHAWGRTYKDLWQRFRNMQGYKQRFQNGFDCQGLWVEVEVEKELGLESKKDIENLVPGNKKRSIAEFVDLCKKRVYKYADIQTRQSRRLGYFMDWENSYFTLSDENNYMIWHFLKECHKKKLIYKGRDSVPWCPRCGTAISQHEMLTEDYKEITHETIFFKLPVEGKDFSLLAWTTTPWTIPGNVALAVNPEFNYILWRIDTEKFITVDPDEIKDEESRVWFEKNVKQSDMEKIKSLKGKDLVGLSYTGPFDDLPRVAEAKKEKPDSFHKIVAAKELVTASKGTGILHVAPGQGQEDFDLGKQEDLAVIDLIDEEANYYDKMKKFTGKNAKLDPELIIDSLKNKKAGLYLFKTAPITHRYPSCWRCKTELVWRVVEEWYIAIDPVREEMKDVAKKIRWIPEFGLKRELDWLDNMDDWLISKKRYWGLALPIWECASCGHFEVIGSREELKERALKGWDKFEGKSPHKPWVDEVKIKCEKCDSVAERVPDVGNPWLDAGIVPFSTITENNKGKPLYTKDKKSWQKWFPADFITESFPGQFKNWFYSLIAMSTVLVNKMPFETVLGFGTLLAEDGRPMHKSWGNAIEFNEGAEKIGVDVMRWMYVRQNPADNLLFGYKVADEVRRRFHLKLWNVYNYFVTYANIDGWTPRDNTEKIPVTINILDKWILARLAQAYHETSKGLEGYDAYKASGTIELFVEDLSNWYIRRSRGRTGFTSESEKDKRDFYATSYFVLVTLSKLLAPFLPFISEVVFRNLTKERSVHLSKWPHLDINVDEKLIQQMSNARELVEVIHAARKMNKLPVRQPLQSVNVSVPFEKLPRNIEEIIKDEVNIKEVVWKKGKDIKVKLDKRITPRLEEEAKTRELIRKIQQERKNLGAGLDQYIKVKSDWLPKDEDLRQKIIKNTLSKDLLRGKFRVEKV
jgi:isoleucyl-tRNA synthetase